MTTRRRFLAAATAAAGAALAAPALGSTLDDELKPHVVPIDPSHAANKIIVVPRAHFLYLVTAPGQAIRYGVGVGKAGLDFQGDAVIGAKKKWPTWRPTDEMLERDPHLYTDFIEDEDYIMPGGPKNPLGARALYLFQNNRDTYYRIHGTTQPGSIGRSVSNGCIRMLNQHVADLYERVPVGMRVLVV